MTRVEYHTYLASREWALLKLAVRMRSGGRCERCYFGSAAQVHHETYERIGHEDVNDLMDLGDGCHEFLSGKRDGDPCDLDQGRLERKPGPVCVLSVGELGDVF